ncbi:MAG: hypothetical protein H8Z69_00320 [Nanohaloarchaea archaeon]|nr:hypothetical protein [Candidatus Nanohaloarchaea archaeon]
MVGIQNPLLLALSLLALPALFTTIKAEERFKKIVGVTKAITVILLAVAAASPFVTGEEEISKQPQLTILEDSSTSMSVMEEENLSLENVKVNRKIIASGNNSDLKSGLTRNIKENQAYLLVSDLQSSSSLENTAREIRRKNASLNLLKTDSEEESAVSVQGPSSTVPGAENSFTVEVSSTTMPQKPEVLVDGDKTDLERADNSTWSFTRSFDEKGSHRIKASIDSEDEFGSNNVFYKTVEVVEKPNILVLGNEGSMSDELDKFYSLEYRSSFPENMDEYYAVIAKKQFDESEISGYLAEGNGLVYTGNYEEQNSVLPARYSEEAKESKGSKIMIVFDISHTSSDCTNQEFCGSQYLQNREENDFSGSISTQNSTQKALRIAYSLIHRPPVGLPSNNKVGAVAYKGNFDGPQLVKFSSPKALDSTHRSKLKSQLESDYSIRGWAPHHYGLKYADRVMEGEGNIIWITPGELSPKEINENIPAKTRRAVDSLDSRLLIIGTGNPNDDFLRSLTRSGDQYMPFSSENNNRLTTRFKAGGASKEAESIVVTDPDHMITEGLNPNGVITGFDPVKPKSGADLLATSSSGSPVLTSWRYGLGRVAAFSAGDKDLSRILNSDPLMATRSVSWAVGQPQRKQEKWIRVQDGYNDEKVRIEASYDVDGLKRQGEDLYSAEVEPETTGFHSFQEKVYAYSYNPEIKQVGLNKDNLDVVQNTGGNVYTPDEKQSIVEDLKSFSDRKVQKQKNLGDYFIIAALLVFLSEVGYRKRSGRK